MRLQNTTLHDRLLLRADASVLLRQYGTVVAHELFEQEHVLKIQNYRLLTCDEKLRRVTRIKF